MLNFSAWPSLPGWPSSLFGIHPNSTHAYGLGASNIMLWVVTNMNKALGTKAGMFEGLGKKVWVWLADANLGRVKIEVK